MWNFIKTFFAALLALFCFFGVFIVFIVALAVAGSSDDSSTQFSINDNSILHLNLQYDLHEKTKVDPMKFGFGKNQLGLMELLACIEKAKTDDHIKGIYLNMGLDLAGGYATIEAIRNQLIDFKSSKKFIIAYGEIASQRSYYLASVADEIYLNPKGGIDFRGFGGQVMFIKGLLDKLEIKTQIYYAGKFKSATEPLRFDKMSEPNRQQVTEYLQDFSHIIMSNVSKSRNIPLDHLNMLTDSLLLSDPDDALENHFIDGLKYQDEVAAILNAKMGNKNDDEVEFVDAEDYYTNVISDKSFSGDQLAVVVAEGDIVDGMGNDDEIGSAKYAEIFSKLRKNDEVKAVVLRINSGGGSALASDVMWRELELLKAKKPVVVSMGDVAASGGYYIAANAQKIFAQPNTITGSIGVFGIIPNMQDFFKNKLGITFDEVEINSHAVAGINKPMDEFEGKNIQKRIEKIYSDFITVVAKGRNKEVSYIDSIAQGRVWSGSRALQIGLVDEIGGLDKAIAYVAQTSKIKNYHLNVYPKNKEGFEGFIQTLEEASIQKIAQSYIQKSEFKEGYQYFELVNKLKQKRGAQMAMPFILEMN